MEELLRHQVLRAAVRDRMFLKTVCRDISADDFPAKHEKIIAELALRFWDTHEEPIGGLLRSDAEDASRKHHLKPDERKQLRDLVDRIQSGQMDLVPVRALEERVMSLRRDTFFEKALDTIITAQEKNQLSTDTLAEIVEKAHVELSTRLYNSTDYLETLEKRLMRRARQSEDQQYPLLLIDDFDDKVKAIGRGQFGIFVGPYNSGKSMFLSHVAMAYALQGLRVLYFTLEDSQDIVENRLDANMTGIPMAKLHIMPNRLRRRFESMRSMVRGRLRIIDATEGGLSCTKIRKVWEQHRAEGFEADAVVVDYDEEMECEVKFTGDNFRKRQFEEIYKRFRRLIRTLNCIGWIACQTKSGRTSKRVITGDDIGEDYSKVKKAWLGIGIGSDPDEETVKHLYVMRHRNDRSRFGFDVVTDFACGMAYDRDATVLRNRRPKR